MLVKLPLLVETNCRAECVGGEKGGAVLGGWANHLSGNDGRQLRVHPPQSEAGVLLERGVGLGRAAALIRVERLPREPEHRPGGAADAEEEHEPDLPGVFQGRGLRVEG